MIAQRQCVECNRTMHIRGRFDLDLWTLHKHAHIVCLKRRNVFEANKIDWIGCSYDVFFSSFFPVFSVIAAIVLTVDCTLSNDVVWIHQTPAFNQYTRFNNSIPDGRVNSAFSVKRDLHGLWVARGNTHKHEKIALIFCDSFVEIAICHVKCIHGNIITNGFWSCTKNNTGVCIHRTQLTWIKDFAILHPTPISPERVG